MKKIFFVFIGILSILKTNASLKDDMLPNRNTAGVSADGTDVLTQVAVYVKDFLFAILGVITIGVFLYFGFKLVISRGNEEEFKKALMGFVYVVVGLAIIPLAWGAVKLIGTLKF